jgi:hypothetical protein
VSIKKINYSNALREFEQGIQERVGIPKDWAEKTHFFSWMGQNLSKVLRVMKKSEELTQDLEDRINKLEMQYGTSSDNERGVLEPGDPSPGASSTGEGPTPG